MNLLQGKDGNGGQEVITINEYPKGGGKYIVYATVYNKNICLAKPKITMIYQTVNAYGEVTQSSQTVITPKAVDCSNHGSGATWVVGCFAGDRMTGGGFYPKNQINYYQKNERNPLISKPFNYWC